MQFRAEFDNDADLQTFGDNGLLLYAMMLKFDEFDTKAFASECLTDGGDDKKIDFIRFDSESGVVTIAQGYYSKNWNKKEAPANKATDLNTAVAWLLASNVDSIPSNLVARFKDIRDALIAGEVNTLELLYVHNLKVSKNVEIELRTCANSTRMKLEAFAGDKAPQVFVQEIDAVEIEEMYLTDNTPIVVTEPIVFPIDGFIREKVDGWTAVVVSITAQHIQDLYQKFGEKLFKPNPRGFIGLRKSARNINHNIKDTAENTPENFWIYNNGITAITRSLSISGDTLSLDGIAVINGAQTTGSLNLAKSGLDKARVMLRVIQPDDLGLVNDIVKFNNTQNAMYPWEFKSNEEVQKRIQREFNDLKIKYWYRREPKMARSGNNVVPTQSAAQALTAFHGSPLVALKGRTQIFDEKENYNRIFHANTTARHICYVYSITRAFDDYKNILKQKEKGAGLIDTEKLRLQNMNLFSFKQFFVFCVGVSIDDILSQRVINKFGLRFRNKNLDLDKMASKWSPLVPIVINAITAVQSDPNELLVDLKSIVDP